MAGKKGRERRESRERESYLRKLEISGPSSSQISDNSQRSTLSPVIETFMLSIVAIKSQLSGTSIANSAKMMRDMMKKEREGKERKKNLERFARLIPGDAVTFHGLAIKSARTFSRQDGGCGKRPQQSLANALQVLTRGNLVAGANVIPIRCMVDPVRKSQNARGAGNT
jgi:hypothetical protein